MTVALDVCMDEASLLTLGENGVSEEMIYRSFLSLDRYFNST
jgi:hypothetical protein